VLVGVTHGTDIEPAKSNGARPEQRRRGRVLLALAVAGLVHTSVRFTFMANVREPPHEWRDRAAWWLPKRQ
jgi:hypothetical protein